MTLREKYGEMYGKDKNLSTNKKGYENDDFNGVTNSMNKSNKNLNYNMNFNQEMNEAGNADFNYATNDAPKTSYLFPIIILLILGTLGFLLYFFRDRILKEYRELTKPDPAVNNELRQLKKSIKEEKEMREKKEKERELEKKKEAGGVNTLVNKINYKNNQIATEDGYCYIGYEKGMRSCTEIYEGDACMSGEMFPSLEICMFPNLRE